MTIIRVIGVLAVYVFVIGGPLFAAARMKPQNNKPTPR